MLARSKRQLDNPIGIDEVTRVEVGDCPVELGMECIDDLGERTAAVVERTASPVQFVGPLRVRSEIDGVGEGIGEIKLHAATHGMTQDQLPGVVAGAADVRPCVE
jgi:hypothetical protein